MILTSRPVCIQLFTAIYHNSKYHVFIKCQSQGKEDIQCTMHIIRSMIKLLILYTSLRMKP